MELVYFVLTGVVSGYLANKLMKLNLDMVPTILVRNVTVAWLKMLASFDPHFCDSKHISSFARLEPTEEGYRAAVTCAAMLPQHP